MASNRGTTDFSVLYCSGDAAMFSSIVPQCAGILGAGEVGAAHAKSALFGLRPKDGGSAPLELFNSFAHPLLLAPRLPFLPLMLTSVYCALGVVYSTVLAYGMWACWPVAAEAKRD